MKIEQILEHLKIEDLPPDLQFVAEESGLDAVKAWLKCWDGLRITFPRVNYIDSLVERYIHERHAAGVSAKFITREIDRPLEFVQEVIKRFGKSIKD